MIDFPILSCLTFLPLLGAAVIFLVRCGNKQEDDRIIKIIALSTTAICFAVSLFIWVVFDPNNPAMQLAEKRIWIDGYNIYYSLGIDGISLFFILLTAFLMPICILVSWDSIKARVKEYVICFLVLETFIFGSFLATDLLLFFLFFETVLIPMFLIIGIWGGENRIYAAFKFFLYTLMGSVFMLIAILYIYYNTGTTDIIDLNQILPSYDFDIGKWLWLAFFISFAVKVPMWPVHTWLPDAHVQAPTAGSVILAGVLLKLGGYGFLRFSLPMFPEVSAYFAGFVYVLSITAVIYTSLIALMQKDMKKLIAYSSIAHMGFVTAGIFTCEGFGISGAIYQMISHGLVSAALFLCVGVLYDRMHTKEIKFYQGLTNLMPKFAFMFMLFTLASVGLPGTSGFIGEFLVMMAVFANNKLYGFLIATGMVLSAAYMLWFYKRVMFGAVINHKLKEISDLNGAEKLAFWPIAFMVIFLGFYPNLITQYIKTSILYLERNLTTNNTVG